MRKQVILCLKVAWVVAALMILIMGTTVCTSTDEACRAVGEAMVSLMVLLTFPTGIIFFPIAMALVDSVGGHYPSEFIIGWSVLAIGGCLQWFYIIPRLLEEPRLTLLNLSSEPETLPAPTPVPVSIQPAATTSSPPANSISVAPLKIRTRKPQNQIRSFDKSGRSPLERVLSS
jgi:hypothetical protein